MKGLRLDCRDLRVSEGAEGLSRIREECRGTGVGSVGSSPGKWPSIFIPRGKMHGHSSGRCGVCRGMGRWPVIQGGGMQSPRTRVKEKSNRFLGFPKVSSIIPAKPRPQGRTDVFEI